jgi:hypothetical protein
MMILEYQLSVKQVWENAKAEFNIKPTRDRRNVIYRHAFSVACLDNTNLSMKVIGAITNRDHATVIHARKNHSWNLIHEKSYSQAYCFFSEILSKQSDEQDEVIQTLLRTTALPNPNKDIVQRYTDIYEAKIKRIERKYEQELETLRFEHKALSKALKTAQKRNEVLNKECLRLKNLL